MFLVVISGRLACRCTFYIRFGVAEVCIRRKSPPKESSAESGVEMQWQRSQSTLVTKYGNGGECKEENKKVRCVMWPHTSLPALKYFSADKLSDAMYSNNYERKFLEL